MDRQFYQDYYKLEREHWWFKVRANIIEEQLMKLNLPKDSRILNVGAATFRSSEMLSQFGKVTSLEYDKECCEFVRNQLKKEVINGSALDLPFETSAFDLVCAFDVVEHIENDKLALKEMRRVCKENGVIFITVPAFNFLWSEHDEIAHHYRRYTKKTLMKVVNTPKEKIIRNTYFNSLLFFPIAFIRGLSNLFKKKNEKLESDFDKVGKGSFLNVIFEKIFAFERRLLRFLNFPIGVSLMVMYKK